MTNPFVQDFGKEKFLIGMVHILALPGTPLYDRAGGMRKIVDHAKADARILEEAGFHSLMYCNESDMPYQGDVPAEIVAAMTDVVAECQAGTDIPHGINVLVDGCASIAVAFATGGRFVRLTLTGSYAGDLGVFQPDGAKVARMRTSLDCADTRMISNISTGFATNLDTRPLEELACGAVFAGLADSVCIASTAGREVDPDVVRKVAAAVPDTPVTIGTGVSARNIGKLTEVADAFIVGTSVKADGKTLNPVDPARAAELVGAFERSVGM